MEWRDITFTKGLLVAKMDFYEMLGVDRKASVDEIKHAYKSLLLEVHPDKQQERNCYDDSAFLAVQNAYSVLKEPDLRRSYDADLMRKQIYVSEVVEAASMIFCEDDCSLSKPCRCGGEYKMNSVDAENGASVVVQCSNCSFYIKVVLI